MKKILLTAIVLMAFMALPLAFADDNATSNNPVDDIRVSYGDTYGDVLPNPENTYDLYISNIPDNCKADEFKLQIDDDNVDYEVIEDAKDLRQIYGQYKYSYTQSNHTLKLDFVGNTHYNPTSKTFQFNVTPAVIYIPTVVTQGISSDRSVEVYLAEGITGNVTINSDGKMFAEREINGRLSRFPLDSLGFGEHDIEVTFENQTKSKRVTVTYILDVQAYADELIRITLPWDAKKTPTVLIDGVEYAYSTDGIKYSKVGTHTVEVTYPGDSKYPKKSVNVTITINNQAKITGPKTVSVFYKDSKKVTFMVYDKYGNPVESGYIYVTLNKISKNVKVTNGKAAYTVSGNLKPGKYAMTAYDGKVFILKSTVNVKHVLSLKAVTVKKSAKKLVLTATLKNAKPIKNKQITFKFNAKTYKAKTNSKGIAKVTIKSSVLKKLKVGKKVTYQATYLKDTVKKTSKVKK